MAEPRVALFRFVEHITHHLRETEYCFLRIFLIYLYQRIDIVQRIEEEWGLTWFLEERSSEFSFSRSSSLISSSFLRALSAYLNQPQTPKPGMRL